MGERPSSAMRGSGPCCDCSISAGSAISERPATMGLVIVDGTICGGSFTGGAAPCVVGSVGDGARVTEADWFAAALGPGLVKACWADLDGGCADPGMSRMTTGSPSPARPYIATAPNAVASAMKTSRYAKASSCG